MHPARPSPPGGLGMAHFLRPVFISKLRAKSKYTIYFYIIYFCVQLVGFYRFREADAAAPTGAWGLGNIAPTQMRLVTKIKSFTLSTMRENREN